MNTEEDEFNRIEREATMRLKAVDAALKDHRAYKSEYERGRADEREQIAQMIEGAPPLVEFAQNDKGGCLMCGFTPKLAAQFIRAKENT